MSRSRETAAARAEAAQALGYAVRSMELADVERVAHVHAEVWRAAYRELLPGGYLASLNRREFGDRWRDRLMAPTRSVTELVGLRPDGSIVALGSAGPNRDADTPTDWELRGLNVLATEQGTGLADMMMRELIGDRPCSLWVLQGNARAFAFYARYCFELDGHAKTHRPTGVTEVRMIRGSTY